MSDWAERELNTNAVRLCDDADGWATLTRHVDLNFAFFRGGLPLAVLLSAKGEPPLFCAQLEYHPLRF
jgi:hypothetical protein